MITIVLVFVCVFVSGCLCVRVCYSACGVCGYVCFSLAPPFR